MYYCAHARCCLLQLRVLTINIIANIITMFCLRICQEILYISYVIMENPP